MTRYTSVTPEDLAEMLETIGVESVEALFAEIPQRLRLAERLRGRGLCGQAHQRSGALPNLAGRAPAIPRGARDARTRLGDGGRGDASQRRSHRASGA